MRSNDREDVTSVLDRTLLVLRAFTSENMSLRLPELVERTRLPKATVYRLVGQLETAGLIERDGNRVHLGLQLFEMGQLVPRQRAIRDIALPFMQELREATQRTVHLGVLDGIELVYVDKLVTRTGPALPSRVGGRMPLYCTGVGKALLAYQPEELVRRVIDTGLKRRTAYTIRTPGHLVRELGATRQTGLAFEREESTVGVACVAAPILNANRRPTAALSIAGWVNQFEAKQVSAAVKSTALAISQALATARRLGE